MNISELENAIKEIETRSEQSHEETFALASTEKFILRTEIDKYESLLKDLEAIRQFDKFVAENQAVVEEYRRLEARVGQIKKPAQKVVNRRKSTSTKKKAAAPVEVKSEKLIPEVAVQPEVIVAPEVTAQPEAVVQPEIKSEKKDVDFKLPDFTMIQALPAGRDKVVEGNVPEQPVVDPNVYRFKKSDIIQDLPIKDLSEQKFKSPGMTDEQIKFSQEKISSIPTVDLGTYVDPLQAEIDRRAAEFDASKKNSTSTEYKAMTPEEIEASRRKIGTEAPSAMTPEEIEASKKKINETPVAAPEVEKKPEAPAEKKESKKGKRKKVVKRRRFDWKNNFITRGVNKAYLVIKGLVFSENMTGHTKDYANICVAIGNYRAAYKNRTPDVNNKEFTAIDESISKSTMLTVEEKKRLYKKLTKLAKLVERQNRKQQNKAMKDNQVIMDELNNSFGFGRR